MNDDIDKLAEVAWQAWSGRAAEHYTWQDCPQEWRDRWRQAVIAVLAAQQRERSPA
jgi:hypothetical protein